MCRRAQKLGWLEPNKPGHEADEVAQAVIRAEALAGDSAGVGATEGDGRAREGDAAQADGDEKA
jgi:hypothetical protein